MDRYLLALFLFIALADVASACDGCTMSRIEWDNPAIRSWMFISIFWFIAQTALCLWNIRPANRVTVKFTVILWVGALLFAYTIGRDLYVGYWPFTLCVFPVFFLILMLIIWGSSNIPRRLLAGSLVLGLVAAVSYAATRVHAEIRMDQMSLAERILDQGYDAGALDRLASLREEERRAVYREILSTGNVRVEGDRLYTGQAMAMKQAAEHLLMHDDLERDMPLILDAFERIEPAYQRFQKDGEGPRHGFGPMLHMFYEEHGISPPFGLDAQGWRRLWEERKQEVLEKETKPDGV